MPGIIMRMERIWEAVVIGAGPAGALAARTLARENRRVLLLEKGTVGQREKACGGMLPLAVFDRYALDETSIQTRLEVEDFRFPWGQRVTRQPVATVHRCEFDACLARQAQAAGAELRDGAAVRRMERLPDGDLRLSGAGRGESFELETRLVIFADGANTLARPALGIGIDRARDPAALGLEYNFSAPSNGDTTYWMLFDHPLLANTWGYAWVFPNRDDYNAGVFFPAGAKRELTQPGGPDPVRLHLRNMLDGKLKDLAQLKRIGARIPMRPARRLAADRALVAGDAAGLVFPLTAGGIGPALWSGDLCGQAAAQALRENRLEAAALRGYESAVKNSPFYREMQKQALLYQAAQGFGRFDRHLFAKIFQIYKLKNELSALEAFRYALW